MKKKETQKKTYCRCVFRDVLPKLWKEIYGKHTYIQRVRVVGVGVRKRDCTAASTGRWV